MADWSNPGSQLVLPARASKQLWLAERRKGVGGSDISGLLGLSQWASPYSVWLDKTGKSAELEESPQMRWGKLHEPAMRQAFTEDTGLVVRQTGLHRSRLNPVFQITPDGLVEDGGVFESKTGSFRVLEDWTDEQVSDHATLQVMYAMGVTGRSHAHVTALIDGYKWHIRRVERDQAMIDELFGFVADWWDKYVVTDTPPPATSAALEEIKDHFRVAVEPVTVHDGQAVADMLRKLAVEKKAVKDAEERAKTIEAQLRLVGMTGDVIMDDAGTELFTLRNDGTFSPSKFGELVENPPMKTVEVLDMDKVKTEYADQYKAARARVLRSKVK